jgi:hypothetical protein
LQVQVTSLAPCAPPTQVAVLPSGHVTEQVCILSALFDEQLLVAAFAAGFGASSAKAGSTPLAKIKAAKTEVLFRLRITHILPMICSFELKYLQKIT